MTSHDERSPGFDLRIADWLEADPDRAPSQVLETVRTALPSISQRHERRMPRPFPSINRRAYLAASIATIAIAGVGLSWYGSFGPSTTGTHPSAPPTASSAASASPELRSAPVARKWTLTGKTVETQLDASVTLLPDGKVLLAGGHGPGLDRVATTTAELFDPSTNDWTRTAAMHVARSRAMAVSLLNGRVLLIGGEPTARPSQPSTAELYDAATGKWSLSGPMAASHSEGTATLLTDGRVLVVGGIDIASAAAVRTVELYDPATDAWTATGEMRVGRASHTATLLPDGKVLVVGGGCCGNVAERSAEVYDPVTATWSGTSSLEEGRRWHHAILLANGKVLIYGGDDNGASVDKAELYDPSTRDWTSAASPADDGDGSRLFDGRVLVKGQGAGELYDPDTNSWTTVGGPVHNRLYHSATSLADGRVLVTYGESSAVFDPTGTP